MAKSYSRKPPSEKCAKARAFDVKASYKNTYEAAKMMKGKTIQQTRDYFEAVLDHKRCVPFTKYNGGVSRTAQAREFKKTQGRWPEKAIRNLLELLKNLEANAIKDQLNLDTLIIRHVQVNRAQCGRRRTYRAHGRITPYMSNPCHVEVWATEEATKVAKPDQKAERVYSLKKIGKQRVRRFLKVGGDQ